MSSYFQPMTEDQRLGFHRRLLELVGIDPTSTFVTENDVTFRGREGVAYLSLEVILSPADVFAAYQEATAPAAHTPARDGAEGSGAS